jgi:hypothetical protein
MDLMIVDELLVIENRYATVMMYALMSPRFQSDPTPRKPATNAIAALDALAAELIARDPSAAALVDSVMDAAADALRAALRNRGHRPQSDEPGR